jgi:hypothetical protein
MVGFSDPADGKAKAAAVSETTTTAGRTATTTAGRFGARLAMDAGDGVRGRSPLIFIDIRISDGYTL